MLVLPRLRTVLWIAGAWLVLPSSGWGFATGEPLSLAVVPATIRQKSDEAESKAVATVLLKDPSPGVFVCIIRSENQGKISFPTIVFQKGAKKGLSEGKVHWKALLRETRVRLSAYNADAPDRKLTFTVTLIPEQDTVPVGEAAP